MPQRSFWGRLVGDRNERKWRYEDHEVVVDAWTMTYAFNVRIEAQGVLVYNFWSCMGSDQCNTFRNGPWLEYLEGLFPKAPAELVGAT